MKRQPSDKLQKAIERVIAGETPYAAAKACGVHLTTIYRSQLYKNLISQRLSERLIDRRKRLDNQPVEKEFANLPARIPLRHGFCEVERENYELLGCLLTMVGATNACLKRLSHDRRQNDELSIVSQVVMDAEALLCRILEGGSPKSEG